MTIGASLPHDSAPLHVTGQARYVDDVPLPEGALHLAFGLSIEAHAEITALDLTEVLAAPGVVAVFSAQNLPDMPDVSPTVHDEPLWPWAKCITRASRCFWLWPTATFKPAKPPAWPRSPTPPTRAVNRGTGPRRQFAL